ncbi:MAG TPA: four helix bundle protein [Nitrospirota bacterium]|nr:four helix bundle protein [Nitrospirota bacterium]
MIAKRFEDLIFWQKARALTKLIYLYTRKNGFSRDYGLRDQIQRSTVSTMSNIAEGFGRGGNNEFMQFLFVSKGSLAEVQSQLYVALDLDYITTPEFEKAYDLTEEICRLINAFVKKVKCSSNPSLKKK